VKKKIVKDVLLLEIVHRLTLDGLHELLSTVGSDWTNVVLDARDLSGYGTETLGLFGDRPETDAEFNSRVVREEKDRAKKAKRQIELERIELKQYKRLKAKFEKA
jgi:hypothetical protein